MLWYVAPQSFIGYRKLQKSLRAGNTTCPQFVEKVCFLNKSAYPQSLSPLGHSVGFASCKAWCVLISASLPKTPFPRERLCMLGWLCIVQSLWAYTPGIRAGAILLGLPPLDQARMLAVSRTKPLHDAVAQMADDLYGGW